jgi:hypothetical protein
MALPAINSNPAGFTPGVSSGFDSYGFDDDSFGSGALYPGGAMGMKNKRAEMDRDVECKLSGTKPADLSQPLHRYPH